MKREIDHRTKRRSSAEKNLAEKLLAHASTRKADPNKFSRAGRLSKAAQKSPRFEYNRFFSIIDDLPIHYFHSVGESITGILGEPGQEMWRGSTYPLLVHEINGTPIDGERVIRLPGNRMLHKLIDAAECIGQRVTITYKGKLFYRYGGHYQKVYDLQPAPLDEAMTKKGRELLAKIQAEAGAEVPKKRDDDPTPLFTRKKTAPAPAGDDKPIVLDKAKAQQILEEAAAKGNRASIGLIEGRNKTKARKAARR